MTDEGVTYITTRDPKEVDNLIHQGFWPVYDDPNEPGYTSAESVYKHSFGIRQNNPRFVILGMGGLGNEYLCFVIAALMGLLPRSAQGGKEDLGELARRIDQDHKKPTNVNLSGKTQEEDLLSMWRDKWLLLEVQSLHTGVALWRKLTHSHKKKLGVGQQSTNDSERT